GGDARGAAIVAELLDDLGEFLADDLALTGLAGEDLLVLGDATLELGQLVEDLLTLERGEPTQLHVQDRGGLELVDLEQLHQTLSCLLDGRAASDQRDDLVELVERLGQPS